MSGVASGLAAAIDCVRRGIKVFCPHKLGVHKISSTEAVIHLGESNQGLDRILSAITQGKNADSITSAYSGPI